MREITVSHAANAIQILCCRADNEKRELLEQKWKLLQVAPERKAGLSKPGSICYCTGVASYIKTN